MRSRVWISVACLSSLPLFIVATGVFALACGWSVRSRLDELLFVISAIWVLLVASAVALQSVRNWLARRTLHILTLSLVLVFALGIGEAGLWLVTPPVPSYHLRAPNLHAEFRPNSRFIPGIVGDSKFTVNSQGIRGPELPNDPSVYRILCVGGSTTECLYLDDDETWPAILMKRLNDAGATRRCWVGNVGVSGYGAAHHLRFLSDTDLLGSINCVVVMIGVNDLAAYTIDHPNERRGRSPLWTRSNMLRLIRQRGVMDSFTVEDQEGANYAQRRLLRQQMPKTDESPDLSIALRDYRSRIESIAAICRQRQVDLVFVAQPVLWAKDISPENEALLWKVIKHNGNCLSVSRSRDVMDAFNHLLIETSKRVGAPCIDVSALSGIPTYYYDDVHFTEEGARTIGKSIADWFLETKLRGTTADEH